MKKALNFLWSENAKLRGFKLDQDEWMLLAEIHSFLKDFETISTTLGGEKYVTLPLVIIAFNLLLDHIEKKAFALNDKQERTRVDEILIEAYQAARDKILKRYEKTNWVYCAVLILDPRHKVETFELTDWGKELKQTSLEVFENMYRLKYFKEENEVQDKVDGGLGGSLAGNQMNSEHEGINLNSLFAEVSRHKNWRDEINEYLSLKRADKSQNVLEWWKNKESAFPTLSKMARDLFSIPATSVPVERLFSLAGLVITKLRNSLSDESAQALLCLHSWATSDLSEKIHLDV